MAGSIAGASFLALFGPVLLRPVRDWIHDDNYSRGFIILPFAIDFAWERRQSLRELPAGEATAARQLAMGLKG